MGQQDAGVIASLAACSSYAKQSQEERDLGIALRASMKFYSQ
jgi:hypothetical protein